MSIASQISRISDDRDTIRAKAVELGIADSTANLDDLASAIEGIVNQGAVHATVTDGDTYTIPKGYHDGSGTVSAVAGEGQYSLQQKTVTPTKLQQNVTPDQGYYGLSSVTVNPIPAGYQDITGVTATAADVLTGKSIVNKQGQTVAGTMPNNGAQNLTIDGLNVTSVSIPAGYTSGGTASLTDDIETALAEI